MEPNALVSVSDVAVHGEILLTRVGKGKGKTGVALRSHLANPSVIKVVEN